MTIAISFRDVLKCWNHLKLSPKINEIGLLDKSYYEDKVKPILYILGMNINYDVKVTACFHRDLDDEVGIGYRFVGTMRIDKEWTSCPACTVMERIQAVAFTDIYLAIELCKLLGYGGFSNFMENDDVLDDNDVIDANGEVMPCDSYISNSYNKDRKLIDKMLEVAVEMGWEVE